MKNLTLVLFVILLATVAGFATWWSVKHPTPAAMPVVLDAPTETRGTSIAAATTTDSSAEARNVTRQFLDANASAEGASSGMPCRIDGRALDTRGAPVARADVTVSTRAETWRAITDADGRFGVDALVTESGNLVLELAGDAWLARTHWTLDVTPEAGDFLLVEGRNDVGNLLLEDRGAIEGRVLDTAHQPVSGTHVVVTFEVGGDEEAATTDAKGFFRIGGLPGGERTMSASGDGWAPMPPTPVMVVVRETTRVADVVLRALPSITGVVVDEDGRPAVGAVIEGRETPDVTGVTAQSGAGGAFVLWLDRAVPHHVVIVPNEEYGLPLAKPDIDAPSARTETPVDPSLPSTAANPLAEPIDAGRDDLKLVVHRRFQVTFRVVEAGSELAIASFGLVVRAAYERAPDEPPHVVHSRGEIRCVAAPGASQVYVWATGYAPHASRVVIDESTADVQTIRLAAGACIRGRVTLEDVPVKDVHVQLMPLPDTDTDRLDSLGSAWLFGFRAGALDVTPEEGPAWPGPSVRRGASIETSSTAGTFEFRDLRAGRYVLSATRKGVAPVRSSALRVEAGQRLEAGDLALVPGATIRGRLIPLRDELATGYVAFLERLDDGPARNPESSCRELVLGERGLFEFDGLAAGSWRLDWSRPRSLAERDTPPIHAGIDVTVGAGDTKDVLLDASDTTICPLEVCVLRGKEPVPGVLVVLTTERGPTTTLRSGGRRLAETRSRMVGRTDGTGTASSTIETGVDFRIDVRGTYGVSIAGPTERIRGTPGQPIRYVLHVEVGSVMLELPRVSPWNQDARVVVELKKDGVPWRSLVLYPVPPDEEDDHGGWRVGLNRLGDFAPGEYDIGVAFRAFRPDPDDPDRYGDRFVSPPFFAKLTVIAGQVTTVVVP